MDAIITLEPAAETVERAIDRIVGEARERSRNKSLNVWRDVYEPARRDIAALHLSAEDYQAAIARLVEGLRI